VRTGNNPVIDTYLRLKQNYGNDILVEVDVYNSSELELISQIEKLNKDERVHGVIIQLPLENTNQTEMAINTVVPEKDVDGLGKAPLFTPATAMAIDWLLVGYNIELSGKKIAIIGNGRLVGAPLYNLWHKAGLDVTVYDNQTKDLASVTKNADVIVSATGVPELIKKDMVKAGAVIVDAGTASENGKIVGDISDEVRGLNNITITPTKGGVGPLTVTALFDNVITAARRVADKKGQQDI
jgi:methylenetetrahydrofolate dehydrogenase (NADP+)/methenyltetrahydrofolate cyclohydrolase